MLLVNKPYEPLRWRLRAGNRRDRFAPLGRVWPVLVLTPVINGPLASAGAEGLDQRRDDLVQVADNGIIGVGEDGGARVGVDGDDVLGARAARDVLDGAADAAGQVELRGDLGAGLADLLLV